MKPRKRYATPVSHDLPPDWLRPWAPGKQYVIPDSDQYAFNRCIDPVHIFKSEGVWCKCKSYFWPHLENRSRAIPIEKLK